jgi:hypothetical protein
MIRNPLEVAASLMARENDRPELGSSALLGGVSEAKALLLWLRHFVEAEWHTRRYMRSFVGYDQLLADWRGTVVKIGADLRITWPVPLNTMAADVEDFLSAQERHYVKPNDELEHRSDVAVWIKAAFRWAQAAVGGRIPDTAELDETRDALRIADTAFMPIVTSNEAGLTERGKRTLLLEQQLADQDVTLSALVQSGEQLVFRP